MENRQGGVPVKALVAGGIGVVLAAVLGGTYLVQQSGAPDGRSGGVPTVGAGVTQTAQSQPQPTGAAPTSTAGRAPAGGSGVQPQTPEQTAVVELAKKDLAARLKVPESRITLALLEEATWNDSSLGCPQPGFMYMQVITPGYRIMLEVDGTQYEYHSDRGRNVVSCAKAP